MMFWKVIVSAVLVLMLTPGTARAVQYPPESTTVPSSVLPSTLVPPSSVTPSSVTPTSQRLSTAPTQRVSSPTTQGSRIGGTLANTGAGNLVTPVRIGVVLMVAGFVLYLGGRNRRRVRAKG